MTDLSNNPHFIKLPQRLIDEIAQHEPTGIMHGDTWHEVQFQMGATLCQCAVVNGMYVALTQDEIDKLDRILKVLSKEELL